MNGDAEGMPIPIGWIRALAEPYLRGYRAVPQRSGSLRGFWFLHPGKEQATGRERGASGPGRPRRAMGFFVGYLVRPGEYSFLSPVPPECLVFAFVEPVGGSGHRRLVRQPESLLRRTFEYIRWLTHRPPRFVFADGEPAALVRHLSMREWPRGKHEHFSRNFFIEALAWLVRSGLVRKLLAEGKPAARAGGPGRSSSVVSAKVRDLSPKTKGRRRKKFSSR